MIFLQLEEELYRASVMLSEGDSAAFVQNKSHGVLFCVFGFFHSCIVLFVVSVGFHVIKLLLD